MTTRPPIDLAELHTADIERSDVRFTDGEYLYVTSGKQLGYGGMGNVWTLTRWRIGQPSAGGEVIVAKTYREEFLILLREDETARRRFDHFEQVVEELRQIDHPNVLPVLRVSPIADNYLFLTPLAGQSLMSRLAGPALSPRERVRLFCQALHGLGALHERGLVHRDFTLHNVLCSGDAARLFDFDLTLAPYLLPEHERTYDGYYRGRVAGSPEFSVAPELLDEVLAEEPISPRIDVYAIGTALFALFTEESLYGAVPDLATLLYRIVEGVVHRRQSRIRFPDDVPAELRSIIETCLEREPRARFADANEVRVELEGVALELSSAEKAHGRFRVTRGYEFTEISPDRDAIFRARPDLSVGYEDLARIETVLSRHGYLLEKSLGRVKGHPIFLTLPDPQLVLQGRFPEVNTYRKIVTAIDVAARPDGAQFVETWLARIHPIVNRVRQGFLTSLHKVSYEKQNGLLLLFSEYVADPRFGTDLAEHELTLEEAFGLGLIIALSIARLHAHGLAHNNVCPEALVFKGRREAGRVEPLFVGLVEPSFESAALDEDVSNLAGMIMALVRQNRIDALRPEARPLVGELRDWLARTASHELQAPGIGELIQILENGLAAIVPNFDLVRGQGGDVAAFADLLVRHSLFNRLYSVELGRSTQP